MPHQKNPMRRTWLKDTDGGWIAHRLELKVSPSWRHRPVPLIRILERIEVEHLRHAGKQNGQLTVAYEQLVACGVSRRVIAPALECGVRLGLIEVRQTHEMVSNIKSPNLYRLTYVPETDRRAPTDEWARVTEEAAKAAAEHFRIAQKQSGGQFPFQQPSSSLSCTEKVPSSSLSCKPLVPVREHTLTSGGDTADAAQAAAEGKPNPKGRARRSSGQASGSISVTSTLTALLAKEAQ